MITTTKKDGTVSTSYVGCVVSVTEESVQVMSDIFERHTYARVFDNETGAFKVVFLFSDYGGSYSDETRAATVDATESILALYEADKAVTAAKKALARAEEALEEALSEARRPGRGKTLKVVKGRKIPKGTVGTCFWIGNGDYGVRVGLKTAAGETLWTAASNCETVIG
jgi:hypothetical protein